MGSSGRTEVNDVDSVAERFESGKSLDAVVASEFFPGFRMDIGYPNDFHWYAVNSHVSLEVKPRRESCANEADANRCCHAQRLLAGGFYERQSFLG